MSESDQSLTMFPAPSQPMPVLSLRDVVVYPYMVIPLFVGRERSILALDEAMNVDKRIVLVTQRSPDVDNPEVADLYEVGTLATVLQLLKLPDGTTKVLVDVTTTPRQVMFKVVGPTLFVLVESIAAALESVLDVEDVQLTSMDVI